MHPAQGCSGEDHMLLGVTQLRVEVDYCLPSLDEALT